MARHEVTVEVPAPPEWVIDQLADPDRLRNLDAGLRSVERTGGEGLEPGLKSRAVHGFYGRDIALEHELTELTPMTMVRTGRGRRITMEERVSAVPHGSGSRVTIEVSVRLGGLLRPLDGGLVAVLEHRLERLAEALASAPVG